MATTYKLVCKYADSNGSTITHSYPYALSDLSTTTVNNFMAATITNGALFKKVPVSKKAAYLEEVETTEFTMS